MHILKLLRVLKSLAWLLAVHLLAGFVQEGPKSRRECLLPLLLLLLLLVVKGGA